MAILGTDVILQFYKEGSYEEFICATECSIEINTEVKDVRGPSDGKWEMVRGKRNSYSVSLNGLIVLGEARPTTFWLIDNQLQWLDLPFKMVFTDPDTMLIKIVAGNALIERSQLTSSSTSFANSSFDFTGNGALTITDSSTICEATIGEISYSATENPNEISVAYEDVTNAARLEYSVDGSPREVIFDPGSNGVFTISGLSEGSHTLQVWAVCESGVDGEMEELSFEIESGGDPGPSCAPPGVPTVEELTSSTARLEWTAASPVPGDGYEWRYGGVALGTVIGSGLTSDLFTELSSLIEGGEYYFEVRSLCEEGVSESIWRRVEFIPEDAPACNVPGSPVMSLITDTTATATWTAPSPVPGDGYEWELLIGASVEDSGTTGSLSVNLTGLIPGTDYTFRVKSICETGVSESGFNSVAFSTDAATNNIDWTFNEDLGNGSLVIRVDGLTVVNVTTAQTGSFSATSGQTIEVRLSAATGDITADDTTASVPVANETGSALIIASFNTSADHSYDIQAIVTS